MKDKRFSNVGKKIKAKSVKKCKRKIKSIAVHCLYTTPDMDVGAKDVHSWHISRGWSGVGYHYIIRRDGTIEIGRDQDLVGAHVKGNNKNTIGVAYAGGAKRIGRELVSDYDKETPEQRRSLIALTHHLAEVNGISTRKILGHNEYPDVHKSCPNLTMPLIRNGTEQIDTVYGVNRFWATSEKHLAETKNSRWISLMNDAIKISKTPFAIGGDGLPIPLSDNAGDIIEAIVIAAGR